MAFIGASDVNAWLEQTKLAVTAPLETPLETLIAQTILGQLSRRFVVSGWLDGTTTPAVVVQLIAMRYAAATYRKQYSEDLGTDPAWPVWLEQTAAGTLEMLVAGTLDIVDAVVVEVSSGQQSPAFYPNDDADTDDPRAFTMQQVF